MGSLGFTQIENNQAIENIGEIPINVEPE